ncbi:Tat pathway signal sequence domain protein [Streptomyces sp. 4F]|nr:Tat pathway signal sequence domain protein [Streptomyces sp. 4F]
MAEIIQKDGTWVFDGDTLRLTPGRDKNVSLLRRELGELLVPLTALAGISFEQGKKSGRLRLRLRDGADPLLHATGGRLTEPHDPYQLTVESDRYGVAEYFVDEVRNALLLDQVPSGPVDSYLLPGPSVPLSVSAGDGVASFDGERVRLEWKWQAEDAKSAAGPRTLPLADIVAVEWQPTVGLENGHLRFTVRAAPSKVPPKYDPNAVELWGFKRDPLMALVAAAVQARLPHPSAPAAVEDARPAEGSSAPPPATEDDHDALLRRLRELGELHRSGVLTDEEFTLAKQAVLKRM